MITGSNSLPSPETQPDAPAPLRDQGPEPTLLIWNPASGRAAECSDVRQQLTAMEHITLRETESSAQASDMAAGAVDEKFSHVIAAGGDGTVNAVVNGLMQNQLRPSMAILPIGTANDFAQTLAIPDNLVLAAALALNGPRRPIDVIEFATATQRRWFANVAAGGNSDEVTRQLTKEVKQRWGPLCYLRGALGVMADLKSFEARVTIDDQPPETLTVWNVIVANGRTNAGHLQIAPRANPEDGLLDLILIRDGDLLDIPSLVMRYAISDYLESDLVVYQQARCLRFHAEPMMRFSIDGEAINEQPVEFSAVPAALAMAVGPDYHAEPELA